MGLHFVFKISQIRFKNFGHFHKLTSEKIFEPDFASVNHGKAAFGNFFDCDLSILMSVQNFIEIITKTYLYNFDPLKPHFYIVKLGFTGVYVIFLISAQKHRLLVLVRTALARRF